MPEATLTNRVQLELIARLVAPQPFKLFDRNRKDPVAARQVQAAIEKAEAIVATVALQLSLTREPSLRAVSPAANGRVRAALAALVEAHAASEAHAHAVALEQWARISLPETPEPEANG